MNLFVKLVLACAFLTGCGITPESEKALKDSIAINAGHVRDETLPKPAREIALDNHDLSIAVLYREGCIAEIPSDVRARLDARAAAKAGK